jgi:hypothetical protein
MVSGPAVETVPINQPTLKPSLIFGFPVVFSVGMMKPTIA